MESNLFPKDMSKNVASGTVLVIVEGVWYALVGIKPMDAPSDHTPGSPALIKVGSEAIPLYDAIPEGYRYAIKTRKPGTTVEG